MISDEFVKFAKAMPPHQLVMQLCYHFVDRESAHKNMDMPNYEICASRFQILLDEAVFRMEREND